MSFIEKSANQLCKVINMCDLMGSWSVICDSMRSLDTCVGKLVSYEPSKSSNYETHSRNSSGIFDFLFNYPLIPTCMQVVIGHRYIVIAGHHIRKIHLRSFRACLPLQAHLLLPAVSFQVFSTSTLGLNGVYLQTLAN